MSAGTTQPDEAAPMTADLVLRGGTVIPMTGQNPQVGDVAVRDGIVVGIGDGSWQAERELDVRGSFVLPGMHDLHDHLRDLSPGSRHGDGLRLDEMLQAMWRVSEHAGPREYELGAALGAVKLVRAGVTSVVDHIYPFHRPDLAEAAVRGYSASGIRWFMARGIMTKGYDPICEGIDEALGAIADLAAGPVPSTRLMVAPVSVRQALPDEYRSAAERGRDLGLRLYTHIAETEAEVEMTLAEYGRRPVELMHEVGFTGPDVVLVHCVQLTSDEIDLLARTGTHVVHCPTNHMKLAKGVTPVPELLARGVNVALGSDIMTDLFDEVRQEILLQGLHHRDPAVISPRTALQLATVGGAHALGMGQELGRIDVGQRADLVVVDAARAGMQPVLDPEWTIAHRATGRDVTHVIVDGVIVIDDGQVIGLDEAALLDECRAVAQHYLDRAGVDHQVLTGRRD